MPLQKGPLRFHLLQILATKSNEELFYTQFSDAALFLHILLDKWVGNLKGHLTGRVWDYFRWSQTQDKWPVNPEQMLSLYGLNSIIIFHPCRSEPKTSHSLSQKELLWLFHWPQFTLFWPYFLWNNSPGSFTMFSSRRSSSLTVGTSTWSLWGEWHNALYGISWNLEFHEPL